MTNTILQYSYNTILEKNHWQSYSLWKLQIVNNIYEKCFLLSRAYDDLLRCISVAISDRRYCGIQDVYQMALTYNSTFFNISGFSLEKCYGKRYKYLIMFLGMIIWIENISPSLLTKRLTLSWFYPNDKTHVYIARLYVFVIYL